MQQSFVGRQKEQAILLEALTSNEAEMVAVIGRRRVGKTFLIKETYKEHLIFEIAGLQDEKLAKQLNHFSFTLFRYANSRMPIKQPANWLAAFSCWSCI